MFVFSPLLGTLLTKVGRKKILILGCLCEGLAMFIFGFIDFIPNGNPMYYGIASFLCRFVEGFGNGCLNSSVNSIIAFNYEDNMSSLIGLT